MNVCNFRLTTTNLSNNLLEIQLKTTNLLDVYNKQFIYIIVYHLDGYK